MRDSREKHLMKKTFKKCLHGWAFIVKGSKKRKEYKRAIQQASKLLKHVILQIQNLRKNAKAYECGPDGNKGMRNWGREPS